jgi:hypothetical protein
MDREAAERRRREEEERKRREEGVEELREAEESARRETAAREEEERRRREEERKRDADRRRATSGGTAPTSLEAGRAVYERALAAEKAEDGRWLLGKRYQTALDLFEEAARLGFPEASAAAARVRGKMRNDGRG